MKNSWGTITVDNSPMRLYLSQPEGNGTFPTVVVIQNQDGVGEFTQEMTRKVAQAGYFAIAPELYHREGEPKTPEQTASIKNYRRDANVINDVGATIGFLRGCANADTGKLGIGGFLSSSPKWPWTGQDTFAASSDGAGRSPHCE